MSRIIAAVPNSKPELAGLPKIGCGSTNLHPRQSKAAVVTKDSLPGWNDIDGAASRAYGATWIDEARSGILFVPSVVSREESNVLINPGHPDAARIRSGREQPVRWDKRLFDN